MSGRVKALGIDTVSLMTTHNMAPASLGIIHGFHSEKNFLCSQPGADVQFPLLIDDFDILSHLEVQQTS